MGKKSIVANPLSRQNIRNFAQNIRDVMGLSQDLYFPVLPFLENVMPQIDSEFYFEIGTIETMGECHGVTYPEQHKIVIREDVYNNAFEGNGRDRFTIAHEIGHYFLHKSGSVALARTGLNESIPPYRDPEWQANAFAGELLMPSNAIIGMSPFDVAEGCGVSFSAATYQLKKI